MSLREKSGHNGVILHYDCFTDYTYDLREKDYHGVVLHNYTDAHADKMALAHKALALHNGFLLTTKPGDSACTYCTKHKYKV